MMIDMHSHILPGVDDGAQNIEDTKNLIREAKEAGYQGIIVTPHYAKHAYEKNVSEIDEVFKNVCNEIKDIKLYRGNEIYLSYQISDLIKERKVTTINNSRYVLFEIPLQDGKNVDMKKIIFDLVENGYTPILAHPERYDFVQKNPDIVREWIDLGVLIQSNMASIIGLYGKEAKKTITYFLENRMIHFLGSDTHRVNTIYKEVPRILEELKKYISNETIEELTYTNIVSVLENKSVDVYPPKPKVKKNLFNKLFGR